MQIPKMYNMNFRMIRIVKIWIQMLKVQLSDFQATMMVIPFQTVVEMTRSVSLESPKITPVAKKAYLARCLGLI